MVHSPWFTAQFYHAMVPTTSVCDPLAGLDQKAEDSGLLAAVGSRFFAVCRSIRIQALLLVAEMMQRDPDSVGAGVLNTVFDVGRDEEGVAGDKFQQALFKCESRLPGDQCNPFGLFLIIPETIRTRIAIGLDVFQSKRTARQ